MAADILLYGADHVPVGDDQKQHVELTRDLATRFNSRFGPTFTLPEPVILAEGARVFDLQNPAAKMSKSAATDSGVVWLLDEPAKTVKKFKQAVTDDDREIRFDRGAKPGVSNLLTILSSFGGDSTETLEERYAGRGYGDLKKDVAEAVIGVFEPVRAKTLELLADPGELDRILGVNADRANEIAEVTIARVYDRIGLLPRRR